MFEMFSLISLSQIQLLPWWGQAVGAVFLILAGRHLLRFIANRAWLATAQTFLGIVVILIFMSIWGQLNYNMMLFKDFENLEVSGDIL